MLCVAALHKALICRQTILSARTRMVTGFVSWDGLHRLRAWECVDISFPELVTRIRRVEPGQHGGERCLYSVALKVAPSFPLLKLHIPLVSLRPAVWPHIGGHAVHWCPCRWRWCCWAHPLVDLLPLSVQFMKRLNVDLTLRKIRAILHRIGVHDWIGKHAKIRVQYISGVRNFQGWCPVRKHVEFGTARRRPFSICFFVYCPRLSKAPVQFAGGLKTDESAIHAFIFMRRSGWTVAAFVTSYLIWMYLLIWLRHARKREDRRAWTRSWLGNAWEWCYPLCET